MLNKNNLHEDLTKLHVMALYDFMEPIDYSADLSANYILDREKRAISRFQRDSIFNARVQSLVSASMYLMEKHLKQG